MPRVRDPQFDIPRMPALQTARPKYFIVPAAQPAESLLRSQHWHALVVAPLTASRPIETGLSIARCNAQPLAPPDPA